ncbi:MAG: membrane protein insertion efficiency factor YidD [Campylobacterota bacterium]|nr:membrane protein insertion efficiency factor YidD [Campylobacterota bacterium]
MKQLSLWLITFYQKFLTLFSYGSCRYQPTCSQYARLQFENNTFFKAIYFTITRILKCNQLFPGGFDYPIVKMNRLKANTGKKIKIKYWLIPVDKDEKYFKIIQNWDRN